MKRLLEMETADNRVLAAASPRRRPEQPLVSVVVPVLDEENCVPELAHRVRSALQAAGAQCELIFVNDGSRDHTAEQIARLHELDPEIKGIHFTRSFGHQAALAAGLLHARGDAVVTMDGDLQHPPESLPALLRAWREGADVVHTVRRDPARRTGGLKAATSRLFYAGMRRLADIGMPPACADFRLLDRRVVEQFNALEERFVFVRGLVPWLGFPEARVDYEVKERFTGESKYSPLRMLGLALDGIFSFSVVPLRLITLLGLATTVFGILYGIFALAVWYTGRATGPPGWTSLMVVILILGGVHVLSIGIVSEYIGRIYEEVKRRPRFVIESKTGLE